MAQLGSTTISGNLGVTGSVYAERFYATSDRRLKTNIKKFVPKKSVLDLNIYEYDFVQSGEHTIGCMADELMDICSEIVSSSEDGTLMINESKIVYLLLNEVKRLSHRVSELERVNG